MEHFFSLQVFEYFPLFLLLLSSILIPLWSCNMQEVISILLYLLRHACDDLLWRKFHGLLRRMYNVFLLDACLDVFQVCLVCGVI
jgi:hypothetical protein